MIIVGTGSCNYSIQIDAYVRPVVHTPRHIPVPMRGKIHEKLDRLVSDEGTEPITEAMFPVSSMVVVHKSNGQIRLRSYQKGLSVEINQEYNPMTTFEDVGTRSKKARFFTMLDAKNWFRQIPLDQRSRMLTCVKTAFRRYHWLRMPFQLCTGSLALYHEPTC